MYLAFNTLGTNNAMSVNGERGIINNMPVNAGLNAMVYGQTVLGVDYLDCNKNKHSPALTPRSRTFAGNIINRHKNHMSFCIIFVD